MPRKNLVTLFFVLASVGVIVIALFTVNSQSSRAALQGELLPNLHPATPSGWSAPIVPAFIAGTNTTDSLYAGLGAVTYFDGAVLNNSSVSINTTTTTCLTIDDIGVPATPPILITSWNTASYAANTFSTFLDFSYAVPDPGTYTLTIEADCNHALAESDETDNTWTAQFSWNPYNGVLLSDEHGFDKCNIGTSSEMQIWWDHSPYQEANIYIGGISRLCSNTGLTEDWVNTVVSQGWNLIPTWVGPQAPCSTFINRFSWNPGTARDQGRREADFAVQTAEALGLIPPNSQTIIYYDLEAYPNHPLCREAAGQLISGWTERLHELGQVSGVYGAGCGSYPIDWPSLPHTPDAVWLAHWIYSTFTSQAKVFDVACVPNSLWPEFINNIPNLQRLRQYAGDHVETHGGVTFNIDSNRMYGPIAGINTRAPEPPTIQDMQQVAPDQGWVIQDGRLLWKNPGDSPWTDITPPNEAVLSAFFLTPDAGWVASPTQAGDGALTLSLFATPDQGQTWQPAGTLPRSFPDGTGQISIQFVDTQTGWASVQMPSSSNFSLGALFRTTDGGQTWVELPIPIGAPVYFVDAQTGWTAGGPAGDELYVTHDGGESWSGIAPAPVGVLYTLPTFVNGIGILPVTKPNNGDTPRVAFFLSHDSGLTWQPLTEIPIPSSHTPSTPFPTSIVNADTWIIANPETGNILLTQDAGQTVEELGISLPGVQAIEFSSPEFGWARTFSVTCTGTKGTSDFQCSAKSSLERSSNGGENWTTITPE